SELCSQRSSFVLSTNEKRRMFKAKYNGKVRPLCSSAAFVHSKLIVCTLHLPMSGDRQIDPTVVHPSIALLQERFRQLERAKEMRQEKELLPMLPESR
ncbi:hypothetical protein SLEP1_g46290, partial [Rubroshorea leprosula]